MKILVAIACLAAAPAEESVPRAEVAPAIARGVAFLLAVQNADGSWGSARRTKGLNIYAPVPGAHHAFRGAVTALCVSALHEVGSTDPTAKAALGRGEDWLLAHIPDVRRATPDAIYNVWCHAYGIQALVRMRRAASGDEERRARIDKVLRGQIERLVRYELVDGGWGYYDFVAGTKRPAGSPTCFTTATVLVAFHEAEREGLAVPRTVVDRAIASVLRQQKPDFSYIYGEYLWWQPMRGINRPAGSLGRSQACNLALRLWGDERITDPVLETWLRRLEARNLWLDIGRKRPIPHEAWFQVAGYFFYYGHYYAALCIEELPPGKRAPFQESLAGILLPLQEKDGSWWDFPFYDYHQPYGTAFALMSLVRCRPAGAE